MKKLALDSSFAINLLRDRAEAASTYERNRHNRIVFPSVAKLEVAWGGPIGDLKELEVSSFGDAEVREVLTMREFLEENGDMMNRLDLMIAAQATCINAELLTFDEDFEKLEDYRGFEYRKVEK